MFIFFCSLFIIKNEQNHVLSIILGTEIISVCIYRALIIRLHLRGSIVFCLVFITFSVCEAALGLGLLARVVRGFGSEKLPDLFILKY